MQSLSTLNTFSLVWNCFYLQILCLLLSIANAKGFHPSIRLPTNELYTNISRTVVLCIDDFGAKGDGFTDDTKSLQNVWEFACSSSSRAKIVIPAGKAYLVGPTEFTGPCLSKVTLRVSGFIVAPRDPAVWEGLDVHKWLYFHGVKHLKIEGDGIIDGSGKEWWERSRKTNDSNPCTHAPTALTFHRCRNLKVKNITFFNSPQKHLAFTHCSRVAASHINIIAPADIPNTDGIHISASTNVELKGIAIRTVKLVSRLMSLTKMALHSCASNFLNDSHKRVAGDDCISIASNSSRIHLQNIFCSAGHGISIGSLGKNNSYAWVEDVVVIGAVLFNTENGVRIKTWQGGSGFARKIKFENIRMHNVSNPIIINQYYCNSPAICTNKTSAVQIESVSFRGIKGTSATEDAVIMACSDSYPCKRLHLENIQLTTLSSSASGTLKSFCWEAYGSSSGLVYPSACISSGDIIIRHPVKSNSTTSMSYSYSLF